MDKNGKRLLTFVISCAAIVLGIYMTFIKDNTAEENRGQEESVMSMEQGEEMNMNQNNIYDYSDKELPTEENETAGESYNNGRKDIEVYFVNTEKLDKGAMPAEAQAVLSDGVQTYLRHRGYDDVTELYVDSESYQEDLEKISFNCFMDGYEEVLTIEYLFAEQTLTYSIMYMDEKGGL